MLSELAGGDVGGGGVAEVRGEVAEVGGVGGEGGGGEAALDAEVGEEPPAAGVQAGW